MDGALGGAEFEWTTPPCRVVQAGWRAAPAGGGDVGVLVLARGGAANAWDEAMWRDWGDAVTALRARDTIRVVVLAAAGPHFTGGLDLAYLRSLFALHAAAGACPARQRAAFLAAIQAMQAAYTALEAAPWPVVAAVQGARPCAGSHLPAAGQAWAATLSQALSTPTVAFARNGRYGRLVAQLGPAIPSLALPCPDAYFCVKEVDVAITADLGTLQRLPAIVGHGVAAEMALTARRVGGQEAAAVGLVSRCFHGREEMVAAVLQVAESIAAKSPVAVWGTKRTLLRTRDGLGVGGVAAGLEAVAQHNAAFLLGEDVAEVLRARATQQAPRFAKL